MTGSTKPGHEVVRSDVVRVVPLDRKNRTTILVWRVTGDAGGTFIEGYRCAVNDDRTVSTLDGEVLLSFVPSGSDVEVLR